MATTNPFDLLGDDAEDPSQLIAAEQLKAAAAAAAPPPKKGPAAAAQQNRPAQLPSKPLPPSEAGELLIHSFIYFPFVLFDVGKILYFVFYFFGS